MQENKMVERKKDEIIGKESKVIGDEAKTSDLGKATREVNADTRGQGPIQDVDRDKQLTEEKGGFQSAGMRGDTDPSKNFQEQGKTFGNEAGKGFGSESKDRPGSKEDAGKDWQSQEQRSGNTRMSGDADDERLRNQGSAYNDVGRKTSTEERENFGSGNKDWQSQQQKSGNEPMTQEEKDKSDTGFQDTSNEKDPRKQRKDLQ
jgi:hypothetical protein